MGSDRGISSWTHHTTVVSSATKIRTRWYHVRIALYQLPTVPVPRVL